MAAVVHDLRAEAASGVLRLRQGVVEKTVYLLEGRPVSVESDLRSETLGAHLVRTGRLTAEDHRLVVERMRQTGRRQGELLIEAGLLGPHELVGALAEHQTEKIVSCFAWAEGVFVFEPGAAWAEGVLSLPMDPTRIVLEGVGRHFEGPRLDPPAGMPGGARPFPRPALSAAGASLRLATRQARIRRAVEHGESLEALVAREGGDRLAVSRFLHALYVMEMIGFDLPQAQAAPPPKPAVAAAPPPPREPPPPVAVDGPLDEARRALEAGEPWAAAARLRQALSEKKEEPLLEAWLGWALFLTDPAGNRRDAERHLEVARRRGPDLAEPYLFMARMLEHDGAGERAEELYRKAAALAPDDLEIGREANLFALRLRKGKLRKGSALAGKGGDTPPARGEAGSLLKRLFTKR